MALDVRLRIPSCLATPLLSKLELLEGLPHCVISALALADYSADQIWHYGADCNVFLVLQVACGGPLLRIVPAEASDSAFANQHKDCIRDSKALVVQLDPTRCLLLVAVPGLSAGTTPVFWGYMTTSTVPCWTRDLMQAGQLAVILDLDETLLTANSVSTLLSRRQDRCIKFKAELQAKLSQVASPETRASIVGQVQALEAEEVLWDQDLQLLDHFRQHCSVRNNGLFTPKYEEAVLADGTVIRRPVVRLEIDKCRVVFTRIDPANPETSMMFRVRPHWDELRNFLAPVDGKSRFTVYVCTAAERTYALEAWRILDPDYQLIPRDRVHERLVNTAAGCNKTLFYALRFADTDAAGLTASTMALAAGPRRPGGLMPQLAMVVDDRVNVWQAPDQEAVLQVQPWMWHRDQAMRSVKADVWQAHLSGKELVRVRNCVASIRKEVYQHINTKVKPKIKEVLQQFSGASIDQVVQALSSVGLQTPSNLLKDAMWKGHYDAKFPENRQIMPPLAQDPTAPSNVAYAPYQPPGPQPQPPARAASAALDRQAPRLQSQSNPVSRQGSLLPHADPLRAAADPVTAPPVREKLNITVDPLNWDPETMQEVDEDDYAEDSIASVQASVTGDQHAAAPALPTEAALTQDMAHLHLSTQAALCELLRLPRGTLISPQLIEERVPSLAGNNAALNRVLHALLLVVEAFPDAVADAAEIFSVCERKQERVAEGMEHYLNNAGGSEQGRVRLERQRQAISRLAPAIREQGLSQPPAKEATQEQPSPRNKRQLADVSPGNAQANKRHQRHAGQNAPQSHSGHRQQHAPQPTSHQQAGASVSPRAQPAQQAAMGQPAGKAAKKGQSGKPSSQTSSQSAA